MITVENLTRIYNGSTILDDISFACTGVLGVIASSEEEKASLLNIIAAINTDFSGEVTVDSVNILENTQEHKKRIGYLLSDAPIYTDMTPTEFLAFLGSARKVPYEKLSRQVDEALELVMLYDKKDKLISNLSKSERKMLSFAGTLLGNPHVVILDDVFSDLTPDDLNNAKAIIKMLGRIKNVIVASADTNVLEISDEILVISDGKAELYDDFEYISEMLLKSETENTDEQSDSSDEITEEEE